MSFITQKNPDGLLHKKTLWVLAVMFDTQPMATPSVYVLLAQNGQTIPIFHEVPQVDMGRVAPWCWRSLKEVSTDSESNAESAELSPGHGSPLNVGMSETTCLCYPMLSMMPPAHHGQRGPLQNLRFPNKSAPAYPCQHNQAHEKPTGIRLFRKTPMPTACPIRPGVLSIMRPSPQLCFSREN